MKKIFTLLIIAIMTISASAATHVWYTTGSKAQTVVPANDTYFSLTKGSGDASWSSKGKHKGTYIDDDGTKIECSDAVKMESTTKMSFTNTNKATVTIVQTTSNKGGDFLKFDGQKITGTPTPKTGDVTVQVYTLNDIAAGTHSITRSSETGLMYVKVVEEESGLPGLTVPTITFDKTTGLVSIEAASGESPIKITYTTDGTLPTEDSQVYSEPFTVADGTTVKAVAIGDGETASNSAPARVDVLLENGTVATPEVKQFNGTFAISCATINAAVQYSLDNGTTWVDYTIPVTLTETKDVKIKATRDTWTTAEANVTVTALPALANTARILLGNGAFNSDTSTNTLTGKDTADDKAEGFVLTMADATKAWGKGNKITPPGRTAIHGSNGVQIKLAVPAGLEVKRITLYSYLAAVTARNTGWKEVNGTTNNSADLVPMASTDVNNPDIRIFDITNSTDVITFTNTGERPDFVMAVDVVAATPSAHLYLGDGETNEHPAFNGEDYNQIYYNDVTNHGVTLKHGNTGAEIYWNFTAATDANEPATNEPAAQAGETTVEKDGVTYNLYTGPIKDISANKGTLSYFARLKGADSEVKTVTVNDQGTSIDEIGVDTEAAPAEYFNLQGVRVAADALTPGIYVKRLGNKVEKICVK